MAALRPASVDFREFTCRAVSVSRLRATRPLAGRGLLCHAAPCL